MNHMILCDYNFIVLAYIYIYIFNHITYKLLKLLGTLASEKPKKIAVRFEEVIIY
jgi:hypothetical protein